MMRTGIWLAAIVMLLGRCGAEAQGIGALFHQQARKKKLMIAQVAAITLYRGQQGKGYAIAGDGLATAQRQQDKELAAHGIYYQSLGQVNAAIGADEKKKDILDLQLKIAAAFRAELSWQQSHAGLRSDELVYLQKVADGMKAKCQSDMAGMQALTTPGMLRLKDAERLDRLDKMLASMKDKFAFTLSFTGRCRRLATVRQRQKAEQQQLQKLYGN